MPNGNKSLKVHADWRGLFVLIHSVGSPENSTVKGNAKSIHAFFMVAF